MQNAPPDLPGLSAPCGGPSLSTLRKLDAGELRGGELQRVTMHTEGCPECQAVLQDFAATRAALRTALPFAALEARLEKNPRRPRSGWWQWASVGAALSVALVVAIAPKGRTGSKVKSELGTTQRKGEQHSLGFVVKSGGNVHAGQDGDALRANDALEFRYNAGGLPYVLIVGVDADGKVFPYMMNGDRSATAATGTGLSPNAVVLDEDPRPERVFALFSKEPIGVDEVKPAVKDGLATQGKIESLTSIPGFDDQATVLIRKAAP